MLIDRETYIKENNDSNVTDMTCNGECSRCGSCCGLFIPFTDEELDIIKEYVKLHNIQPYNRINVLTNQFNAQCCFFDATEKKCRIYPARPYVCRDFICNRKDWQIYRDKYEKMAKYNSTINNKTIMATFDDMVYGNYEPILRYIFGILPVTDNGVESAIIVELLQQINRLDLLDQFSVYNEKGEKLSGKDLLKEVSDGRK